MAAGKNYLKTDLVGGIPANINIYTNAAATSMSLTPSSSLPIVLRCPVFVDGSGSFIFAPLDPASITGLTAKVQ